MSSEPSGRATVSSSVPPVNVYGTHCASGYQPRSFKELAELSLKMDPKNNGCAVYPGCLVRVPFLVKRVGIEIEEGVAVTRIVRAEFDFR